MGDAPQAPVVSLNVGGLIGFLLGMVVGQLALGVAVGVPGFAALAIASQIGASAAVAMALAGMLGAVLCAAIGVAFGRRRELDWWFLAGAAFPLPALALILLRGLLSGGDAFGAIALGAYVVANVSLIAGFWLGRRRRSA